MKYKVGDKVETIATPSGCLPEEAPTGVLGRIVELFEYENQPYKVKSDSFGVDMFWFYAEGDLKLVEEVKEIELTEENIKSLGVKYDSDKLEYSLLPKGVLTPILKVLSFGKKKYAADNWMKVDNPKERYYNAMQRHINQWWEGEKYDSETGENHLAHAACCLMFLLWFENKEDGNLKGKDN